MESEDFQREFGGHSLTQEVLEEDSCTWEGNGD